MSISSPAELVEALRTNVLVSSAQLDQLSPELLSPSTDLHAFAQWFVDQGLLTAFQAEKLLQGQASDLLFGPYRLLELLGEGGMGQVFKAFHQPLNRMVALKVIRRERTVGYEDAVRRFRREAKAAAQLSHPNVVTLFDYDAIGDTHFIAMEYVEGIDLARLVKEQGPLPILQACNYIRQAAMGLQHSQERGMVHRDIKPSNLLVTPKPKPPGRVSQGISGYHRRPPLTGSSNPRLVRPAQVPEPENDPNQEGTIKILDMGLARLHSAEGERTDSSLTREGTVMGTPDYIAPEQARNAHNVDCRADLYSLGCTFYYLLTGRPPFTQGSTIEKLLMHQLDNPTPVDKIRPAVPPGVAMIIKKLMAKKPEDRYQTPQELAEALNTLRAAEQKAAALASAAPEKAQGSTAEVSVEPEEKKPPKEYGQLVIVDPVKKIAKYPGHRGAITSMVWSRDRAFLVSGGLDGAVRIEDFSGPEPKTWTILRTHKGEVNALAFDADRKMLATGAGTMDGTVFVWDMLADRPNEKAVLRRHKSGVEAMAFSHDAKMLATGCTDGSIRLWDILRGENRERFLLRGHSAEVRSIAFSPDSQRLVSGGGDGTVRLWKVGWIRSTEQAVLHGHLGQVNSVAFSIDGKTVASASMDQTIRLWDVGEIHPRPKSVLTGHANVVRQLQYTTDSKALVSVADGGHVILWEPETEKIVHQWQLKEPLLAGAAFTADGRYLAIGLNDGSVHVYRLASRKRHK